MTTITAVSVVGRPDTVCPGSSTLAKDVESGGSAYQIDGPGIIRTVNLFCPKCKTCTRHDIKTAKERACTVCGHRLFTRGTGRVSQRIFIRL